VLWLDERRSAAERPKPGAVALVVDAQLRKILCGGAGKSKAAVKVGNSRNSVERIVAAQVSGYHTLRGYVREAELFKDHAGAGLL
jgi:hypothetical protein